MKKVIDIQKVQPAAFKAMARLDNYISATSLSNIEKELIKLRASQVNGCTFCIELHTKIAIDSGETLERIAALSSWAQSDLFTAKEKALLKLTEEVTKISEGISDAAYDSISVYYSDGVIAEIVMIIVTINAWNRISIASRL
jgi:AhpD family alkylhydroperoxidase